MSRTEPPPACYSAHGGPTAQHQHSVQTQSIALVQTVTCLASVSECETAISVVRSSSLSTILFSENLLFRHARARDGQFTQVFERCEGVLDVSKPAV